DWQSERAVATAEVEQGTRLPLGQVLQEQKRAVFDPLRRKDDPRHIQRERLPERLLDQPPARLRPQRLAGRGTGGRQLRRAPPFQTTHARRLEAASAARSKASRSA